MYVFVITTGDTSHFPKDGDTSRIQSLTECVAFMLYCVVLSEIQIVVCRFADTRTFAVFYIEDV